MRILVCGIDGYIGWSLALHLGKLGHEVYGLDNLARRKMVREVGSWSATPILGLDRRAAAAKELLGIDLKIGRADMRKYDQISKIIALSKPDTIVQLAEQPSAPYSMIDRAHAVYTQENNILGTLNLLFAMKEEARSAHLVKLGTMGEYGTPNIDIPEGFLDIEFRGRKDRLPFPKQAGSFYHWSKVHDSGNVMFACRVWGLRSTDVMQGIVYGTRTYETVDDRLLTRFDFDEIFGTVVNRYCAQLAIGYPLTLYGSGGQQRSFISLVDSIQCLTLGIENPPDGGTYRVFNQIDELHEIWDLAHLISGTGAGLGLKSGVITVENPRLESEAHHYSVDSDSLRTLGFRQTRPLTEEIQIILKDLTRFRKRIEAKKDLIRPTVSWKDGKAPEPRVLETVPAEREPETRVGSYQA